MGKPYKFLCAWCLRLRSNQPSKSVCHDEDHDCASEMARVMRLYSHVVSAYPKLADRSPSVVFARMAVIACRENGDFVEMVKKEFL